MATIEGGARMGRKVLTLGVGLILAGMMMAPATHASPSMSRVEDRGSDADQRACTPDVFRLCAAEIPNEPRIVACLIRSKPNLSPACRMVFDRPSNPPAQTATRKPGHKVTHNKPHNAKATKSTARPSITGTKPRQSPKGLRAER